jgi:hypothetical protein
VPEKHPTDKGLVLALVPGVGTGRLQASRSLSVVIAFTAIMVAIMVHGSKGHAAEHFTGARRSNRGELFPRIVTIMVAVTRGESGRGETVGDFYKFVGIRALISTSADRRCDGIYIHGTVVVYFTRDVTAAVRCRVE